MKEIGRAPCIVAVISDKSLRSPYCMYELLEAYHNPSFKDRVFPIVLADAKIDHLKDRLGEYVTDWKTKYEDLEQLINTLGIEALIPVGFDEYENFREIYRRSDELLGFLANMYTSKPDLLEANNFELLKQAITDWFEKLKRKSRNSAD